MDLFNDLPEPKNDNALNESSSEKNDQEINDKNGNKKRPLDQDENESSKKTSLNTLDSLKNEDPNKKIEVLSLKAFFAERQGERDSMQDRHVIIKDFSKCLKTTSIEIKKLCFYAVYDGHAGSRAADYCAENLHKILADKFSKAFENKNNLEKIEKDIKRYFVDTFKQCNDEFLKIAANNKPSWKDGTTATVLLIINDTLYSANVGDSKAIIYGNKEKTNDLTDKIDFIIELTREHSASVYEERQRIQKSGGTVKDGRVLGVLEVSRSIGDGALKAYGVTCVPDIRKCQLNSYYKFVLLACDGLWKSFTNEEAVAYVNSIKNKSLESSGQVETSVYELCCNRIANESVKRLSADNVTVMIISIESSTKQDEDKN